MKKFFFLKSKEIAQNAARFILDLPCDPEHYLCVEIKEKSRSLDQSAKLHAIFGELEKKAMWDGEKLTDLEWKNLIISGHTIATKAEVKLVRGLEGELVNLRESTAKMTVERMSSLIEYVQAWCAENDVSLSR